MVDFSADALTLWALLLPPSLGLLWAISEAWSISKIRLVGPGEGDNKSLTDLLYGVRWKNGVGSVFKTLPSTDDPAPP